VAAGGRLTELVQSTLDELLSAETARMARISPDLAPVAQAARDMLSGGKRFRARFCYWGWRAVRLPDPLDPMPEPAEDDGELAAVVRVAAGVEALHAAALVHDDIIDRSATRRGAPSAHERFAAIHRDAGWTRDAERFGESSAILLGDLLLSWADGLVRDGAAALGGRGAEAAEEFGTMRTEVTLGQYLDVLEEHAWIAQPDEDAVTRAQRVVVYKSAKYSIEAPLVIGARLGGATAAQVESLRRFGIPLGIAYQLRDDLLGVYGDPEVTGKPAGDDLREGKRTVLIALARAELPGSMRSLVDDLLGDPELDADQVEMLRRTLRDCGAVDRVERAIERNLAQAIAALEAAELAPGARTELIALARAASNRSA